MVRRVHGLGGKLSNGPSRAEMILDYIQSSKFSNILNMIIILVRSIGQE